ncbi:MAG: hypothetical protein IT303_20395 [Dehalococcoidia bacterium]|nr:hypothetical protein [Dehalococcoidia bacterium]
MKDKLIAAVVERTGLDPAMADKAVDAVMDFLKDDPKRVTALLGQAGIGDIGDVGDKLGKLFGR